MDDFKYSTDVVLDLSLGTDWKENWLGDSFDMSSSWANDL
jgi:hypothetical protein